MLDVVLIWTIEFEVEAKEKNEDNALFSNLRICWMLYDGKDHLNVCCFARNCPNNDKTKQCVKDCFEFCQTVIMTFMSLSVRK